MLSPDKLVWMRNSWYRSVPVLISLIDSSLAASTCAHSPRMLSTGHAAHCHTKS